MEKRREGALEAGPIVPGIFILIFILSLSVSLSRVFYSPSFWPRQHCPSSSLQHPADNSFLPCDKRLILGYIFLLVFALGTCLKEGLGAS